MIKYESINHQHTSLADREEYFRQVKHESDTPSVFLQTCNRMELYHGSGEVPDEVARHLFRVVSGLESAIIGERAVQGQVKEAYTLAKQTQKLPTELHKLFETALQVGKRVRTETQISQGAVSHSLAAIEIIEQEQINLQDARITIVGVNKLTEEIIKFLQNKKAKLVFLANRTEEKARRMAEPFGIDIFRLEDKHNFLKDTDILISATSAPDAIIHPDDLTPGRSLLAIDLAFPRDIDPAVAQMENVKLYNLHDVELKVKENISIRQDEVQKAEQIIEEAIAELRETLERRKRYKKAIRVTARSSKLSQIQVKEVFGRFPDTPYRLITRQSYGDKHQKISLLNGEAPDDMFTRELDTALLTGKADIAIHSAKDLPESLHPDLEVIALYEAFDKTDSLVSRDHISLADLPEGSSVGTSSPLRRAELLQLRPDLKIVSIRGCIEDRVEQVRSGKVDAAIVATCALKRLGMEDEITEVLPFSTHPMQGRLAITALKGRDDLKTIFAKESIL
ncbi:glutamyl-tRNA reductase [Xylanibacter brevis]|uniref:glutamyl-tRNA reductase n=1 Tax=Xylanibacter brevis TaxID=83231 RepID=UPI00048902B0|nr:glutamyl-tRNA reductase [Xylanibacter brevis]